jgi:hypothetical protein
MNHQPSNPSSFKIHTSSLPILGVVTTYGYKGDSTPDTDSSNGIGAWDNKLSLSSIAVSRDIEAQFRAAGIKPKGKVLLVLDNGETLIKTWDDRTARAFNGKPLTGRFDFYCPSGKNPLEGIGVLSFRKA